MCVPNVRNQTSSSNPRPTLAVACNTPEQHRAAGAQWHQLQTNHKASSVSWWEPAQPRSPLKGTCWQF